MIASPRSPARLGKLGAVATHVNLNDNPIPFVGSDAEMPEAARQLCAATQLRSLMEIGYGAHFEPIVALVGMVDMATREDGPFAPERAEAMLRQALDGLVTVCRKMNA